MSRETNEWLNRNVLVGDTNQRGYAWHYRASDQGGEPNHYPGAIPVEDVKRRLFDWEPIESPLYVAVPSGVDEDGSMTYDYVQLPNRKAIVPSDDPTTVLGVFKSGYEIHGYGTWLVDNVGKLLDGEMHISSAGLLSNRARAWVEIGLSDNHRVDGFDFRPNLLAATSVDGTLATSYRRTVQAVVCDNTLDMALSEGTQQLLKVKHSKYSRLKLQNARDALGIVMATADEFSKQFEALMSWTVTDKEWSKFLDTAVPVEKEESKAAVTKAENKRETLTGLYRADARCAPWTGTAFGVVQTINTYDHHVKPTRKDTVRAERNMADALTGQTAKSMEEALKKLAVVCGR